jgi:hypothetical protein
MESAWHKTPNVEMALEFALGSWHAVWARKK